MILTSHGLTDPGCVRAENQDRILFDDTLGLYVVCDGLGGRRRGEVAAELATNTIRQYIEASRDPVDVTWPYGYSIDITVTENRLRTAAKLANRQVWRRSEESLEYLGMGTTVSALLIVSASATVVNIGDSRVYLLRDRRLEQLTVDDTLAGTRLADPDLPMIRNILTRAAGAQENIDVHLKSCALESGDLLLLCSDGLRCVEDAEIAALLCGAASPAEGAARLLMAARTAGAPDNVSAVLVHCRTA